MQKIVSQKPLRQSNTVECKSQVMRTLEFKVWGRGRLSKLATPDQRPHVSSWGMLGTQSLQSCPTLCNPIDCSPPGFFVHGILQTRIRSGLPCPYPGDLPNPGIEPSSLTSPELAGRFFTTSATWEASVCSILVQNHRECHEEPLGDSPGWHLNSLPPFFVFHPMPLTFLKQNKTEAPNLA